MLAIGPHSCTSTILMNMPKRKSKLSISSKPKSKPSRQAMYYRKKRMKIEKNKCRCEKRPQARANKQKEKEKQEQNTKFGQKWCTYVCLQSRGHDCVVHVKSNCVVMLHYSVSNLNFVWTVDIFMSVMCFKRSFTWSYFHLQC